MPQESGQPQRLKVQLSDGSLIDFGFMDPNAPATQDYVRGFLAKYRPEEAKKLGIETNGADEWYQQLGNELAVGGGQLVSGIEGALNWATGQDSQDNFGGQKFSNDVRKNYSVDALRDAAKGDMNIWRTVVESAPSTAAGMIAGGGVGLMAKAAGATAGLAGVLGIGAGAGVEATQGAGDSYNTVSNYVNAQRSDPQSPIKESEVFKQHLADARSRGLSDGSAEDEAWRTTAKSQAQVSAPIAGLANLIPSIIGGMALNRALAPVLEKFTEGVVPRILKASRAPGGLTAEAVAAAAPKTLRNFAVGTAEMAGSEGVEEFLQSGGEQFAQNVGTGMVDPRVGYGDNVLESAVQGGLAGVVGGGIAGVGIKGYGGYQDKQIHNQLTGAFNAGAVDEGRVKSANKAHEDLLVKAAYAGRDAHAAERQRQADQFAAESKPWQFDPTAPPQDPAIVPRIGRDTMTPYTKPQAFPDQPGPESADITAARQDVFSHIENLDPGIPERATVDFPIFNKDMEHTKDPKTGQLKTRKTSADKAFDEHFAPDPKVVAAHKNYVEKQAQYNHEIALYEQRAKQANPTHAGYEPQIADALKQAEAANRAYAAALEKASPATQKRVKAWNAFAKERGLPEVVPAAQRQAQAQAAKAAAQQPQRPQAPVEQPVPAAKTTDQLVEEYSAAADELTNLQKQTKPDPVKIAEAKSRVQALDTAIAESYAEPVAPSTAQPAPVSPAVQRAQQLVDSVDAGGVPSNPMLVNKIARGLGLEVPSDAQMADTIERVRQSLAQPAAPSIRDTAMGAQQEAAAFFAQGQTPAAQAPPADVAPPAQPQPSGTPPLNAQRLLSRQDLPVVRTDVKTPHPDVQLRHDKFAVPRYKVVPVTDAATLPATNAARARDDGVNAPGPTGYRIEEFRDTLDPNAAPTGKVGNRTFATREEAEDRLADKYDRATADLPASAWERKATRDQEKEELAREREATNDAAANLAAKTAFEKVFSDHSAAQMKIATDIMKKMGLDKHFKIGIFDPIAKEQFQGRKLSEKYANPIAQMIHEYNQWNPNKDADGKQRHPNFGMDAAEFTPGTMGSFLTYGSKDNPLAIIALNKYLINPNMNQEDMKKAVARVLHHELVHGLVRSGFVTPQEYSTLLRIIRKRKRPDENGIKGGYITYLDRAESLYKDATPQVQQEEAIAELIAMEGFGVSKAAMSGEARTIIDKIVRVIRSIFNMLQDKDFRRFVDFMESVKDGSMAQRIVGLSGLDPANLLDPLGRDLGASRADMKASPPTIAVPVQGPPEKIKQAQSAIEEAKRSGVKTDYDYDKDSGVVYKETPVPLVGAYANNSLVRMIPSMAKIVLRDVIVDSTGHKTITIENSSPFDPTRLRDIFDFSALPSELSQQLGGVLVIPERQSASSIAGATVDGEGQGGVFLYEGKPTWLVMLNSSWQDEKILNISSLLHEIGHLTAVAAGRVSKNHSILPVGQTSLLTPGHMEPGGSKSMQDNALDISRLLIAANAKIKDQIDTLKQGAPTMTEALSELDVAAKVTGKHFWDALYQVANLSGPAVSDHGADAVATSIANRLTPHVTRASFVAPNRIRTVLQRLIEQHPDRAKMLSDAAYVLLQRDMMHTIRYVREGYKNYNLRNGGPQDDRSEDIGLAVVDAVTRDIIRVMGVGLYYDESGEQATTSRNEKLIDPEALGTKPGYGNYSKVAAKNATVGGVGNMYPDRQTTDDEKSTLVNNVGITPFGNLPKDQRFASTRPDAGLGRNIRNAIIGSAEAGEPKKADMKTGNQGGFGTFDRLNAADVALAAKIAEENPLFNVERITKKLNAEKTSSKRGYRPNEVQDMLNKISSINPAAARDGMNIDAIIKFEKVWGTENLKGIISDAVAGMSDSDIAASYGLARSTVRSALSQMNVVPRDGRGQPGIPPERAIIRLPASVIESADAAAAQGMGMKPLRRGEEALIEASHAISSDGRLAPSRAHSYILQQMLRETDDGARGHNLGQIVDALRASGYRGGNAPVIKIFSSIRDDLRSKFDPEYHGIGGPKRADMATGKEHKRHGVNIPEQYFKPFPVDAQMEGRARMRLAGEGDKPHGSRRGSPIEYDVFDLIRSAPPEGITTSQITDEINQYRNDETMVSPQAVRDAIVQIRRQGFAIPAPQYKPSERVQAVIDMYKAGKKGTVIAQLLYAEDMREMDGKTDAERLARARNTVSSIISQYNKKNPARADMTTGDDDGEGGDPKIVDLGKTKETKDLQKFHGSFMDKIKTGAANMAQRRKDIFGVDSVMPEAIGRKVMNDLRKENPKLHDELVARSQEFADKNGTELAIHKNLGEGLANKTSPDSPERAMKHINRTIESYARWAKEGRDGPEAAQSMQNISDFYAWARDKYLVPYYSPNKSPAGPAAPVYDFKAIRDQKNLEKQGEERLQATLDSNQQALKDAFGVSDPMNVGAKIMGDLRRDKPFVWKTINDKFENPDEELGKVVTTGFNAGRESAIASFKRRVKTFKSMARQLQEGETQADRLRLLARSDFLQYVLDKYLSDEGPKRAEMSVSTASASVMRAIKNHRERTLSSAERYANAQTGDAILDQMGSLHRLFGKLMGDNTDEFIRGQIDSAEGLERLFARYRQAGGTVDAASNPAFANDANRGKTRPEIEQAFEESFKPVLEHVRSLDVTPEMIEELSRDVDVAARWFEAQKENGKKDLSYNAAGLYLLAKHAPYREAFIKSKRKQTRELVGSEGSRGVGIQLDEAAKIVKFFDDKLTKDKTNELSLRVQHAVDRLTKIREDGGLIPRGLAGLQYYVPARGFAERDGEEDTTSVTLNSGSRGRTAMRQDRSPRGRLSLPDDPFTALAQMTQVAVMRKNMNATLNALRRLVENNAGVFEKNGKFVAAVHYEKPRGLDLNNEPLWLRGRLKKTGDGADVATGEDADIFYIELAPEFLNVSKYFMPSMHTQGNLEKLLAATNIVAPLQNVLRQTRTSLDPTFAPKNLFRDVGTGFFSIETYVPGAQTKFLGRIPSIMRDLMADFRNSNDPSKKPTTKYGKEAEEFINNGGNQNLYVVDDYDQIASQIAHKMSDITNGSDSAIDKTKKTVGALAGWLEKANSAAELVSRVAAYTLAKERALSEGKSMAEAIQRGVYVGRNITVNFNKAGVLGKGMNNIYMFWNASVGGTSQILRALESSPKIRAQIMTVAALGFALPFIMRALMGDDYDKIPDWVKDRNFIIPTGVDGAYLTVPMPYGYSWFMTMGQNMSEAGIRSQNPLYGPGGAVNWLTLRTVDGLMNNFAPTGSSNDFMTLMAPTLLDPFLEIAMNKDWTGRPIMPEPGFRDTDRDSQRFWSNTSPLYTGAAGLMSSATGGHGHINGLVEISPEILEYSAEFIFGGLGKFLNQSISVATGKAENTSDVPFVRNFVGSTGGEINISSDYAELQNRVKRVEASLKDAKAGGNYDLIGRLERDHAFEIDLIPTFKATERQIEKQQAVRRAINSRHRESPEGPNAFDAQRLEDVKQRIKELKTKAIDAVAARQ